MKGIPKVAVGIPSLTRHRVAAVVSEVALPGSLCVSLDRFAFVLCNLVFLNSPPEQAGSYPPGLGKPPDLPEQRGRVRRGRVHRGSRLIHRSDRRNGRGRVRRGNRLVRRCNRRNGRGRGRGRVYRSGRDRGRVTTGAAKATAWSAGAAGVVSAGATAWSTKATGVAGVVSTESVSTGA